MDINEVVSKMGYVNDLINSGRFDSAYENVKEILGNINNINTINSNKIIILSNLAGNLIDIGSFSNEKSIAEEGLVMFINNKDDMLAIMSKSSYYYNLANGMGAVLEFNPHSDADISTFDHYKHYREKNTIVYFTSDRMVVIPICFFLAMKFLA
ncbi:hypothetical protein [Klebsiella variicola]|uniref:hypothetical protein n=1 Tax=Klebsiella variicola TaxID=244366 RepID=UPI0019639B8B|nr:hypothetical protein [Klebsiella variicola]